MILRSVALPTTPTTKITQDSTVFTYLNATFIDVLRKHAGGEERGRACTDPFPETRDDDDDADDDKCGEARVAGLGSGLTPSLGVRGERVA